ncbi:beta barrel domain-containing protein [Bacillus norwichensis]|uniref:IDEAL domain-containing protein n=1 Tax=Bacillus norwichensis TaxID=2762217 RepID=A0ABR8VM43_9BACI|nr:hypothetical protein [Bacillus norwichensis]MBD8005835.1 hypothetical protein [Bacillus norwichensis]
MSVEIGQTIYVSVSNMFTESEPNLTEYVVTKVNTMSFYAHRKGDDFAERRFDKRTMIHNSFCETYKAYFTEKEYWDKIALLKEKMLLCSEIRRSVVDLDIKKLRQIQALINA